MMHKTCNGRTRSAAINEGAPLRALHSLTEAHVEALWSEVRRPGEDWCFERHMAHDGHLLLLITPPAADEADVSFALHRNTAGLHLSAWHHDEHVSLGAFSSLGEVGLVIRRVMADGVTAAVAAA